MSLNQKCILFIYDNNTDRLLLSVCVAIFVHYRTAKEFGFDTDEGLTVNLRKQEMRE